MTQTQTSPVRIERRAAAARARGRRSLDAAGPAAVSGARGWRLVWALLPRRPGGRSRWRRPAGGRSRSPTSTRTLLPPIAQTGARPAVGRQGRRARPGDGDQRRSRRRGHPAGAPEERLGRRGQRDARPGRRSPPSTWRPATWVRPGADAGRLRHRPRRAVGAARAGRLEARASTTSSPATPWTRPSGTTASSACSRPRAARSRRARSTPCAVENGAARAHHAGEPGPSRLPPQRARQHREHVLLHLRRLRRPR